MTNTLPTPSMIHLLLTRRPDRDLVRQIARLEHATFGPYGETQSEILDGVATGNLIVCAAIDRSNNELVGHVIAWSDDGHTGSPEIISVAVAPTARRRGIGSLILVSTVDAIASKHDGPIRARVRELNMIGQCFLRSCGFACERILHGFYHAVPAELAYEFVWRPPQRSTVRRVEVTTK